MVNVDDGVGNTMSPGISGLYNAGLAQLDRAGGFYPPGRGFESYNLRHIEWGYELALKIKSW